MKKQHLRIVVAIFAFVAVVAPQMVDAKIQVGYTEPDTEVANIAPQPYPGATDAGPYVWTREISRPGATFIKVHFAEFDLAPGDVLTIESGDGAQIDEYREQGLRGDGAFWSGAIRDDRAIITLSSYSDGGHGIRIDELGIGENPDTPEAVCGSDGREDVACYGAGKSRTEPVARILFQQGGGFFVCTGFLVRGSNTDNFMTNQHCVDSQSDINTVEAWFNYQNANCGGNADDPIDVYFGETFLRTNASLDYTLMTLTGSPEANHGELIATRDSPSVNDRFALPQHSGGFEKEVAVFESANRSGGPCRIDAVRDTISGWGSGTQINYSCDMEGGSSGSPLLGRDSNPSLDVIGINHVETIGCFGNQGNYATHMDDICDDAGSLLNCS